VSASEPVAPTNRLLASLPDRSRKRLIAHCKLVALDFERVLCKTGDRIRHVYFPVDGFISLVTTLEDGARLEVGIAGDEGMLGISLILGVNISPQHALVQGAGSALRMNAADFCRELDGDALLRQSLGRYVHVQLAQLAQFAACTHFHRVDARLARWLLMTRDRAHSNRFRITQQFLALMLGVRRAGISEAASLLQSRGLIRYHRGEIAILNSGSLERTACRCYQRDLELYEHTMAGVGGGSRHR
jgi:CRP-like cAMP-binding protein